jgi:hypothetical protein
LWIFILLVLSDQRFEDREGSETMLADEEWFIKGDLHGFHMECIPFLANPCSSVI